MNEEVFKQILQRVIENDNEAKFSEEADGSDFAIGRQTAYYEVLDIIKNDLIVNGLDIDTFGLSENLEEKYL